MISITLIIVILTVIISITGFQNQKIIDDLIFNPVAINYRKQWYRFFTCALVHMDVMHLAFNMIAFYSFGTYIEQYFNMIFGSTGPILFVALYVISQFLCLIPTYLKHKDSYSYRSLGASGAVSAIIFAGIFLDPLVRLGLLFIPLPIPGFIFGFIYLAITYYLDRKGGGHINHSAHFYGAVAGILLLITFGYLFSPYSLIDNFIQQIRSY